MSDIKSYLELDLWKQSRILANYIYTITKDFPKEEIYGLTNQIRRCAVSVPSNIAEGCGRQHKKESLNFFFISRGSLYELETLLYLAFDQQYITTQKLNDGIEKLTLCKNLLNGFINYFQTLA